MAVALYNEASPFFLLDKFSDIVAIIAELTPLPDAH